MTATRIYDHLIIGGGRYAASLLKGMTNNQQRVLVTDRQLAFPKVGVEAGLAAQQRGIDCQLFAGTHIVDLRYTSDGLLIAKTRQGKQFTARQVTVVAGASTLELAHRMGYGLDYFLLPVKGFCLSVGDQQSRVRYFTFRTHPDQPLSAVDFWRLLKPYRRPAAILKSLLTQQPLRQLIGYGLGYRLPWLKSRLFLQQVKALGGQVASDARVEGPLPPEQQLVNRVQGRQETQELRLQPSEELTFIFPALGQHDLNQETSLAASSDK